MMVTLIVGVSSCSGDGTRPPVPPDGARHDVARLAGPDHELGAVRGLQPAALALAGDLAARVAVADGRAVHRHRLRDLLHRCRSSRRCWVLRRLQAPPARRLVRLAPPARSALSLLIFVIGFVFDAFLEIFLVRTGLYIYSQVIPWGSLFAGKPYQFPLIWESALVTLGDDPGRRPLYRDDTGRTQAEKLAHRARLFRSRPALGTFLGDVRDRERRLPLSLWRWLRADP